MGIEALVILGWNILKILLIIAGILFMLFILTALLRSFLVLLKKEPKPKLKSRPKAPQAMRIDPKAPPNMKLDPKVPPNIFDKNTKH